jgi:hypothetical protein
MLTVTIAEQIAEIEREISIRKKHYPRWVLKGYLTQPAADLQNRRLEAAVNTLRRALVEMDNRDAGRLFTGEVYGPAKVRADQTARILALLAPMVHTDVLLRLEKKIAAAAIAPCEIKI